MTEEEYFRKHYPDVCYNGKPLSPYWDFFQDGVEFGERQSENKIEELERKLEQTEKDLTDYQFNYPKIKELEKENAELKGELKDANEKVVHLACNQNKDLKYKLTKAKDLLKKMYYLYHDPCVTNKDLENRDKLFEETEQFLKEIEK